MAEAKSKLKMSGLIIGIIIVITLLVFAALFISGMAEGTFTIFGFDRPSPPASFYNSLNLNQDLKPVIGTGEHPNNTIAVAWTSRSDLSSGVIDPITNTPVDINNEMGYLITPYVNGSKGQTSSNYIVVPGINISSYNVTPEQISNATGITDISNVTNIAFTVKTFVRATITGNESSMTGTADPNLGVTRQTFMNFDKPSTKEKITHLKLHNHMHVRGSDSLKNLNTSSKVPHHGPKVGMLDSNTVMNDTYFQAPF
jgi:hypothetical protein